MKDDAKLHRIRHSLAHIMAQAVQQLRPGTRLGFGPAIEDGFYYDFFLPEDQKISADDLEEIEGVMREILASDQTFERSEVPGDEALALIENEMQEPHKAEYAKELLAKEGAAGTLSFYRNGPFLDMCEGPHVESTKEIKRDAFRLYSVTGAYWRGDEKRAAATRVYGWAFETAKQLRVYVKAREEAMLRDHRKLGAELDLYAMSDDVGQGLPLWLPHGAVIVEELERLAKEWEFLDGYERVRTPVMTRGRLYQVSGHLDLYRDDMFPGMPGPDDEEMNESTAYFLRPMNCPHHHMVFAARPRSYRDLPLRLAEYGHTFRYERSGSLHGLSRVRAMCMNDAHIYITEDQIRDEFVRVMRMHQRYYELFEFTDYFMRLSCWDPDSPGAKEKYIDDPDGWALSEAKVREAMIKAEIPFVEQKGEAAFYGPKVDIQFKTVGLKEFTVSTCQLDFGVPQRFVDAGIPMTYVDRDGGRKTPYVIHRAPLSTHERFISFLIEHYAGAFPMWLSPVQVRIVPLSADFIPYGEKICAQLRADLIRAEVDRSDEHLKKKIREGTIAKIPVLLVVGEQERAEEKVTVRRYKIKEQRTMSIDEFHRMTLRETRERRHVRDWKDLETE